MRLPRLPLAKAKRQVRNDKKVYSFWFLVSVGITAGIKVKAESDKPLVTIKGKIVRAIEYEIATTCFQHVSQ